MATFRDTSDAFFGAPKPARAPPPPPPGAQAPSSYRPQPRKPAPMQQQRTGASRAAPPPPPAPAAYNSAYNPRPPPAAAPSTGHNEWFSTPNPPAPSPASYPVAPSNAYSQHNATPNGMHSQTQKTTVQRTSSSAPAPQKIYSPFPQQAQPQPQLGQQFQQQPTHGVDATMSGPMSGPMQGGISSRPSSYDPNDPFADEPPLLEELGVNIPHILAKGRAVILPFSYKKNTPEEDALLYESDDLAGPLILALVLASEMLLSGKMHGFSYIYGFALSGCLAMALLLNLLSPPTRPLPIWSVISIMGYSLLPVNVLAFLNIFVRIKKLDKFGVLLAGLVVLWCTIASTKLFERGWQMRDQRYLVGYPAGLVYTSFVIITIF